MRKQSTFAKTAILTLAALAFVFALTACSGTSSTTSSDNGNSAKSNQTSQTQDQSSNSNSANATSSGTSPSNTAPTAENSHAKLLYMGHASARITTSDGKVIYIDPYVGNGYDPAADLILVTHGHYDHTALDKVSNRASDCQTITWKEALAGGNHQTFDLPYVAVEAVEAGYNKNHDSSECVGYILTFKDGTSVYFSGDTSTTPQMPSLADRNIDYAFFCCDGVYNMGTDEAAECAKVVGAKHNIPYHMIADSDVYFDRSTAEQFNAPNRLIIEDGEEIELVHSS